MTDEEERERKNAANRAWRSGGTKDYCEAPRCGNKTRERKPYCLEHVTRMPYVMALLRATV